MSSKSKQNIQERQTEGEKRLILYAVSVVAPTGATGVSRIVD